MYFAAHYADFDALFARARIRQQQLVVADVAVVAVERGKGIGGLFEHLLGHGDRVAQLLEIQRGDTLRSGQCHDLIVDQSEEVFD